MGPVKYNINTFVDKNKNSLSPLLCSTMYNGSHPLLKSLFPEGNILKYYSIPYYLYCHWFMYGVPTIYFNSKNMAMN